MNILHSTNRMEDHRLFALTQVKLAQASEQTSGS
ncbi:MAG: hypothetical protein ACI89J_004540, partial [Hyphomicrobiaceae bacterium]